MAPPNWTIPLLVMSLALCACETTMPKKDLVPVQSGRTISIASAVFITEKRGLAELNWELLPGMYVERYRNALGAFFESEGSLVQFTPTLGGKTRHVGGFVVLAGQREVAKLYIVRRGEVNPIFGPVGASIVQGVIGPPGDVSLVTDFPLSRINATGW
jgi:hypothetical protein